MLHVKILGTSHISERSAQLIRRKFDEFQPDVLAIELDQRRLNALIDRRHGLDQRIPLSTIRQAGLSGYLFLILGSWLQKRLAGIVKVQPGVDMLAAVDLGKEHNRPVLLIDQDILVTMHNLKKQFTLKEKTRLVWDVLCSPFQKRPRFDLKRVPPKRLIRELMTLMKEHYPGLYDALLIQRNIHMCASLDVYARTHPDAKALVIVGAGHEDDLKRRLKQSTVITTR